jgi:hypothetical protein
MKHYPVNNIINAITCHPDVLEAWHQLTVKAAHGVSSKEACALPSQVLIDLAQM